MINSIRWGATLVAISIGSCVPKPPVPTPPAFRAVAVVVPDGMATGSAYVDDTGGGHTCRLVAGYCEVTQTDAPAGQTYLIVNAEGYEPYRQDGVTLPAGNTQIWLGTGCGMPNPKQCVNLPALTQIVVPPPIEPPKPPTYPLPIPNNDTQSFFFSLVEGKPFGQATLLELEPTLNRYCIILTAPNANGDRTKIYDPITMNWTRVGFGEGHWVWIPQGTEAVAPPCPIVGAGN